MPSYSKEQRREDIFRAANPVFQGTRILGEERDGIRTRMSNYPTQFESVVRTYEREMVVQIISSLIDNGRIAARSNCRLEVSKTHPPSTVRRRQQDALEEAAAQSEAKAMDEASRSDLHLYKGDQGGEQTDVTGHILCLILIIIPANVYARRWTDRRPFRVHFLQLTIFVSIILVVYLSA